MKLPPTDGKCSARKQIKIRACLLTRDLKNRQAFFNAFTINLAPYYLPNHWGNMHGHTPLPNPWLPCYNVSFFWINTHNSTYVASLSY